MLIIFISFSILGLTLITIISRYWQNEKYNLLAENALGIASLVSKNSTASNNNIYLVDTNLMKGFISTFSSNIDADIFITNNEGKIILSADTHPLKHLNSNAPKYILERALTGRYAATGNLDGIYDHQCYFVCVPINMDISSSATTIGFVFTAADADNFSQFRIDIIKMFLFASIAALVISFLFAGAMSYKIVRPLQQMSTAVRRLGKGDFTQRVCIDNDDELGELAAAFNNMAESLSTSENIKRNFISNVSHELKTPMTTISGFVDGILDGTIPSDKRDYYLEIVSDEIKRLSRLVKTMLNLSKIDNGDFKINKQRFDLTNTILISFLSFEKKIEEKNIKILGLHDLPGIFVYADPDMIHQVIYNLIENAVKFVNIGGYISVKASELDDKISFEIENSGTGIPADEINMIFDKFYKTDKSRSKDKNGMGLGLYIVRTIINLHGGNIFASSVENNYCKFEFYLPKHNSLK